MKEKVKDFLLKWNAILIAFILMMYSVTLGLSGNTEEAQYSAHWPGTILLFSLHPKVLLLYIHSIPLF